MKYIPSKTIPSIDARFQKKVEMALDQNFKAMINGDINTTNWWYSLKLKNPVLNFPVDYRDGHIAAITMIQAYFLKQMETTAKRALAKRMFNVWLRKKAK